MEKLPLLTDNGVGFSINRPYLQDLMKELEQFVAKQTYMNQRDFSRKVMFSHEIKSNNTIEGINDSVLAIEEAIKDAEENKRGEIKNRIINLYKGYRYILKGEEINEDTVHKLNQILSEGLLDADCLSRMGEKYRRDPVYILKNGRLDDSMDIIPPTNIEKFMDCFFRFVNNGDVFDSETVCFLKSQIMHFYFVYIHPYYDINGRTSRTVAMWYLLNHQVYPYIIFNRGINFDSNYDRIIRECKERREITLFLEYMLITVKKELEKEYVLHHLKGLTSREWKANDYQTLEYFLSMTGNKPVLDFVAMYSRYNYKRPVREIFETMLVPFLEDGTLSIERETQKCLYDGQKNLVLSLNRNKMNQIDTSELTRLHL